MDATSSNEGASQSSRGHLEADNGGRREVNPNSDNNLNPKKGGRFSLLRSSFSKKDKSETTLDATNKKKAKKSKKDKKKADKTSEASEVASVDGDEIPPLLRRKSSHSSIASTLVRKISFGKLKPKLPVVSLPHKTLLANYDSSSPTISPTLSTETLETISVPNSANSSPNSIRTDGVVSCQEVSEPATPIPTPAIALRSVEPGDSKPHSEESVIRRSTSKVKTAWLTEAFETSTMTEPTPAQQVQQLTTKDQILSITTPLMERQALPVTTPSPTTSSRGADVFFTPRDMPSPPSQETGAGDNSSTSIEAYKTPEGGSSNDVIVDPRSYSSPSFSVASSSAAPATMGDKREHLYKILVIGELGTGKTSIIKRYVHQFFSQHYRATIGVDFALKVLNWDANTIIRLQLWDIAGQERFGNMTRVYYKEAVGAFIVFDVTRAATFDAVVKWKQDLDSKVQLPDGSPIPCVLLANKCDQQKEGLVNNPGKMDEYCKERGFSGWFETSAKENINIEEAARSLVTKILENDQLSIQSEVGAKDGDRFNLGGPKNGDGDSTKSKCSC